MLAVLFSVFTATWHWSKTAVLKLEKPICGGKRPKHSTNIVSPVPQTIRSH